MNWNSARVYKFGELACVMVALLAVAVGTFDYFTGQSPAGMYAGAAVCLVMAVSFQIDYYHKTGIQEDKI